MNEDQGSVPASPPSLPTAKLSTLVLPVVTVCGHKIKLNSPPTQTNCLDCWQAFFQLNPEGVGNARKLMIEGGVEALEKAVGKKFVKYYVLFLQQQMIEMATASNQPIPSIEGDQLDVPSLT